LAHALTRVHFVEPLNVDAPITSAAAPSTAASGLLKLTPQRRRTQRHQPADGHRGVTLTWIGAARFCHTAEVKPLRCLLHLHVWHTYHNDEGQRYQLCTRCGAYREKYTLTDYRAGPNS
jgi:hypothetical protein